MYDTIKGSDYLADQEAVEILAKEAPNAIITLEHMGVPFTRNMQGKIEQRRFGGHTRNYGEAPVKRACYVSDRTGRAIMDTLYDRCQTKGVDLYNEVFILKLLVFRRTLLRRCRLRYCHMRTSGFSCKSSCFSNRWKRQNLQNNIQRVCFHSRRLRISDGFLNSS